MMKNHQKMARIVRDHLSALTLLQPNNPLEIGFGNVVRGENLEINQFAYAFRSHAVMRRNDFNSAKHLTCRV